MSSTRTAETAAAGSTGTSDSTVTSDSTGTSDGTVTVNGVERPHHAGTSVAALVAELLGGTGPAGDAPTGVAVAVDDAIVPRGLWARTTVAPGARVEVVTAVQGG